MAGATEQECKDLLKQLILPGNSSAEIFLWEQDSWAIAFVFGDGVTDEFQQTFRQSIPARWTVNWFDSEYRASGCSVFAG